MYEHEWQLNVGKPYIRRSQKRLRLGRAPDWPHTPTGLAPDKGPEQHRCTRSLVIILHQPSLDRRARAAPLPLILPLPLHCIRAASTFSLFPTVECGIVSPDFSECGGTAASSHASPHRPRPTSPPPPPSFPHLLLDLQRPALPLSNTHSPLRSLHRFIANPIIQTPPPRESGRLEQPLKRRIREHKV